MVKINRDAVSRNNKITFQTKLRASFLTTIIFAAVLCIWNASSSPSIGEGKATANIRNVSSFYQQQLASYGKNHAKQNLENLTEETTKDAQIDHEKEDKKPSASVCPIAKISELSMAEQYPKIGERHMITPPQGGEVVLVCCETTKGPMSIMVHNKWAPIGSNRFLDMVRSDYFNKATVPMMRCLKKFLCQFGLSSDPALTKPYNKILQDDKPWLPQGPKYRKNEKDVKRFAVGYLAYAGSGPNSRSNQFIIALKSNGGLAGGSPWEVPWGEIVGDYSFETLSKIYTGYGEKGPSQGKLHRLGMTEEMKNEFSDLDYITGCSIVDQEDQDKSNIVADK